jgi:hypothetical protein
LSKQISIPDELYEHISEQADKVAVPVETFVTHLLENGLFQLAHRALIDAITQAYANEQPIPSVGTWTQVEVELAATVSPFESLEAAMNHARGRP